MSSVCTSCRRPVPLTPDEVAILDRAAGAPGGVLADGIASGPLRSLVRMGYVVKVANDQGVGRRVVVITERGRAWLAGKLG